MTGMTALLERVACPRCAAAYHPRLTDWTCPVCDAAPPEGGPGARRPRRAWHDADNRLVAIVLMATVGNILLLAVLAAAVLHVS